MKQYEDLPCRLVIVIGSHSGGTSAATGVLTKNGFYNQTKTGSFEASLPFVHLFRGPWYHQPRRPIIEQDYDDFARWARRYKDTALQEGFDKAVQKWPNNPIWIPELLQGHCGISVCPLLVWRDPKKCAASIERRWGYNRLRSHLKDNGYDSILDMAKARQDRILELHDLYGWPLWRFSADATQTELEKLLGVPLPVQHFQPDRIEAA